MPDGEAPGPGVFDVAVLDGAASLHDEAVVPMRGRAEPRRRSIDAIRSETGPPVAVLNVLLRVGVAACYIGHGVFGVAAKPAWIPLFGFVGIAPGDAVRLMPWVGASDIALGVLALFHPARVVFLHLVLWGLWTASLRPLTGLPFAEMLERAGNYGVPFAALVLSAGTPWWRPRTWAPSARAIALAERALRATTALLLLGHGMLALAGSATLRRHHAAVGLDGWGVDSVFVSGAIDVALAAVVPFARGSRAFLAIAAWKLATEALFPLGGESGWEFVERAGSYVAPLSLAVLCGRRGAVR